MYADTWWALYRMSITSSNTEEQAFFSSSIAFSKRWLCEERITENRNICWQLEYSEKMLISFWCGLFVFFFFGGVCVCVGFIWVGWYFCWSCSQARNGFGWSKLEKKRTKGPCCSLQPVLTLSIRCSQQRNAYFTHNLVLQQMSIFFLQDIWMYIRKYIW